jgi:hypothetical protein
LKFYSEKSKKIPKKFPINFFLVRGQNTVSNTKVSRLTEAIFTPAFWPYLKLSPLLPQLGTTINVCLVGVPWPRTQSCFAKHFPVPFSEHKIHLQLVCGPLQVLTYLLACGYQLDTQAVWLFFLHLDIILECQLQVQFECHFLGRGSKHTHGSLKCRTIQKYSYACPAARFNYFVSAHIHIFGPLTMHLMGGVMDTKKHK